MSYLWPQVDNYAQAPFKYNIYTNTGVYADISISIPPGTERSTNGSANTEYMGCDVKHIHIPKDK